MGACARGGAGSGAGTSAARLEWREGSSLLRAFRERVHRHLGYGAFAEYTDRHLGYCHRTTADKLRTAEALERLPELARAQQEGNLHASAVRGIRRQVLLRDQRMCQVPGCRNSLAIDVHHIQPRAEGGTHHAHNQVGLCTVHHRAIHRGELHVSGRAPDALVFQHPDGTAYGGPVCAPRVDVCKKVFDGLCRLGFKSSEARRALDECSRDGDPPIDAQTLLRKALACLG